MAHPPVIDLSDFQDRRDEIVKELMSAATTTGFFYVKGHGIPQELVDAAFAASARWFDQPLEVKEGFPKVDWTTAKVVGFERNTQSGRSMHEGIMLGHDVHDYMRNAWPDEKRVAGFKSTTLDFMASMRPVALRILSCFALGLGFPADFFEQTASVDRDDNRTFLEYHKYFATEGLTLAPGTNRITAHTDETLITLLWPSPGSVGLELAAGKDGKAVKGMENGVSTVDTWQPCPPLDGCIVINVGDALQMWSDGLLRSNYHRVRMPRAEEPQGERYSIGYFIWPRMQDKIQGKSKKYEATTMGEYIAEKGKIFANSFSMDEQVYNSSQQYAYGALELKAAG